MAVMAKAIFLLPSMFVLRTRRMCWNFSGMTRDFKTKRKEKHAEIIIMDARVSKRKRASPFHNSEQKAEVVHNIGFGTAFLKKSSANLSFKTRKSLNLSLLSLAALAPVSINKQLQVGSYETVDPKHLYV